MSQSKPFALLGAALLINTDWVYDHALIIVDKKIQAILPITQLDLSAYDCMHCPAGSVMVPGFIDMHIHGAQGFDVMDATKESLQSISLALAKEGVTGFLATTMTASQLQLELVLKNIAAYGNTLTGAKLLGIHLEGPFLAANKKGAQKSEFLLAPDLQLLTAWQQLAQGMIKMVTFAPELDPDFKFLNGLNDLNIKPAFGHSDANFNQATAAMKAGGQHVTHLYNAMRPLHHREPGLVGAALLEANVCTEIIADGIHVHPALIAITKKIKGINKLCLVTDAMRAKCMPDGDYELGGEMVQVKQGKAELADGTLAGSTLTMANAISNLQRFTGCSLAEAIYMATYVPAQEIGVFAERGSLAVGKIADVVVLDQEGKVEMTVCEGRII